MANYGSAIEGQINEFFINNGDGTFTEAASALGLSIPDEAFVTTGGAWGDYDADGWLDLYVTNKGVSGQPNRLFRNIRGKGFVRQTDAGVEDARSSSGAVWFDFDGDSRLDLFVANRQRNSLYRNLGGGVFGDASESATITDMGLVAATADFNLDGDEDLYVGRTGGDLLLANLNNPGLALHLELVGAGGSWGSSHDATHTRVTLTSDQHAVTRVVGECSGMGQSSRLLAVPLSILEGDPTVHIEWSRGTLQEIDIEEMGRLTLDEVRVNVDGAIRAVVLPFNDTHGEAFVAPEVSVEDNGISPHGFTVYLDITDELGDSVAHLELAQPAGAGGIVQLPLVSAPPAGDNYTFQFRAVTPGDEAAWNDQMTMTVTGGEAAEDFERPPVYWELSEGWGWTRSGTAHEAYSGQGFLLLQPGSASEYSAVSPGFEAVAGGVWCLEFMAQYDLMQDSLTVTVSNATEILGRKVLGGNQQTYTAHAIEFSTLTADYLEVEWRCTTQDTAAAAVSFCLDDVALSLVTSGDPALALPAELTVRGPWPNPSKGKLTWRLMVPNAGIARVETYDLAGRLARMDRLGRMGAGEHMVMLSSSGLAPGVYVAKFFLGTTSCSRMFVRLD